MVNGQKIPKLQIIPEFSLDSVLTLPISSSYFKNLFISTPRYLHHLLIHSLTSCRQFVWIVFNAESEMPLIAGIGPSENRCC